MRLDDVMGRLLTSAGMLRQLTEKAQNKLSTSELITLNELNDMFEMELISISRGITEVQESLHKRMLSLGIEPRYGLSDRRKSSDEKNSDKKS